MTTNQNTNQHLIDYINTSAGFERYSLDDDKQHPAIIDHAAGQSYWYASSLMRRNALRRLASGLRFANPDTWQRLLSTSGCCGVDAYPVTM